MLFRSKYLGMARQRDTAQLNLKSNKGKCLSSTHWSFTFCTNHFLIHLLLLPCPSEHLSQITSDRDSLNARVTKLKNRIATLEKEAAVAKKEAAAAVKRAEEAELKEQAAAKKEEDLLPRLEAIVNSLSGKIFPLLLLV